MRILITGGLGFVGRALAGHLRLKGHDITIVERNIMDKKPFPDDAAVIEADTTREGPWQDHLAKSDVIINLAGASIFTRWSRIKKQAIYDSRIMTTRNISGALIKKGMSDITFISTSAVGYYGFHGDEPLDEDSPPGGDFLAKVCTEWESAAMAASPSVSRVVITRFGVILGPSGGALSMLEKVFRWRVGARLGQGKQWFSWIHINDLARIFEFIIETKSLTGAINCSSPGPVTNRELTRALNKSLGTWPIVPPAPGFALKLLMGEFGDFLLKGQRAVPKKLIDGGFSFNYPSIDTALQCILNEKQ